MKKAVKKDGWWVYIARCSDGSLYCGSTPDLDARIKAHNEGSGAKYTRGRGPIEIAYRSLMPDRSSALREEARIKRLARPDKLTLIASHD
jgi:putative endonuclease